MLPGKMYFKAARGQKSITHRLTSITWVPLLDIYRKNSEQPLKQTLLREDEAQHPCYCIVRTSQASKATVQQVCDGLLLI